MGAFSIFSSDKDRKLKESFRKLRIEMDDHLDSINENTNELNSMNEYIAELEEKIVKMGERLDEAEMKISELSGKKTGHSDFRDITLSTREEEIFLLLYSRNGDLLDYREISKALGVTEEMARKNVANIIAKGIPIVKKYFENSTFLVLDSDFRTLQAKENVIRLKNRK
jgi:chromosome segregation ATPase